ncbi:MAG: sigma-E processing peptidase SpoIIGA [Firmicutes bacterium]|nr:sigma-E processing peptidase SpoIIGA [Bacillota bacterium]
MEIWIEQAIIDNMVVNAMLLYFVFRTVKQRVPRLRVFFASLVGTGFALALPLLTFTSIAALGVRLFVGALMTFIVQNRGVKRWLLFYLIFLAYTFAFGGAVIGVMTMTGHTFETLTPGMIIGVVVVFALVMRVLVKFLNVRHSISNHLRDIVIHHRGHRYKITSYLDTGNRLRDPTSGAPVVIISLSLFLKMFPDIAPDKILLNRLTDEGIEDGRYIDLTTVAGETRMFTFQPTALEILRGKTHDSVRLGVSMRGFRDAVKYDALLNAQLA